MNTIRCTLVVVERGDQKRYDLFLKAVPQEGDFVTLGGEAVGIYRVSSVTHRIVVVGDGRHSIDVFLHPIGEEGQ